MYSLVVKKKEEDLYDKNIGSKTLGTIYIDNIPNKGDILCIKGDIYLVEAIRRDIQLPSFFQTDSEEIYVFVSKIDV